MKIDKSRLLHSQIELLDTGFMDSNQNWVICAPTGAGKTRMGEWVLEQAAMHGRKGIYLAPLKAIVEEKSTDWAQRYPEYKIGLFTGETTRRGSSNRPNDELFLLMTSEKLASYLHMWKKHIEWLSQIDVVVIDEFHLLNDPNRGPTVESLIGRLQRINPFIRLICLSATVPNSGQIAEWLNGKVFVTTWRPVPLTHRTVSFRKAGDKPQLLVNEVAETIDGGGQVLVFVNSRRRCERLSEYLGNAGFRAAFYHAGLGMVSRGNRQCAMKNGDLDVLVSTSSLEMGVNFPARKVVVYDSYVFTGDGFGPLPIGRYHQFAGRAGRLGLDATGEAVIFLPHWHKNSEKYTTGQSEPIVSGLNKSRPLLKEIVTEVTTRLSISKNHLKINFSSRTFRHFSNGLDDLNPLVDKLINADLLAISEKDDRYLTQTPLGRIATQMDVSPETIRILDGFYRHVPGPCLFDCILAVCLCPELTPQLPFNFENIDAMQDTLVNIPSHLLDANPSETIGLMNGRKNTRKLLSALKTAVVLMRHTSGESIEILSEEFDCYPMDISILKRNTDWILATAIRVFAFRWKQQWEKETGGEIEEKRPLSTHEHRIKQLIPMVKYGLPYHACDLVKLKGIGSKRSLALHRAGLSTLESVSKAPPELLSEALKLSESICATLRENALELIADRALEVPFDFPEDPLPTAPHQAMRNWPQNVDPYRLRRALELNVKHRSEECIQIDGGTEPHTIQIRVSSKGNREYQCDCMDATKGHLCKHTMRARLEHGDGIELIDALRALQQKARQPLRYALADLWIQSGRLYDRYEDRHRDYDGKRFLDRLVASERWNR